MSLPRSINPATFVPSHSSSPSKSSLRSQKSNQQPRSLLPSPHFEDDLEPPSAGNNAAPLFEQDEESSSRHDTATACNFQPLFTLLNDTQSSEHYHPTVHYIFADDETDLITEAALRCLAVDDPDQPYTAYGTSRSDEDDAEDEGEGPHEHTSKLPITPASVKEHYILIDVAPSGDVAKATPGDPTMPSDALSVQESESRYKYKVLSASSLSPSFAVLNAEITSAPTFESPVTTRRSSVTGGDGHGHLVTRASGADPTDQSSQNLMLKIEGVSALPADERGNDAKGKAKEGAVTEEEAGTESLEDLVIRFQERLAEIRKVVAAGAGEYGNIPSGKTYDTTLPEEQ